MVHQKFSIYISCILHEDRKERKKKRKAIRRISWSSPDLLATEMSAGDGLGYSSSYPNIIFMRERDLHTHTHTPTHTPSTTCFSPTHAFHPPAHTPHPYREK
jgi:hypothetical protein